MSDWDIIVPEGTTNYIVNPSFETGILNWTNAGLTTIEQSSTRSKFGAYSMHMISDAAADGAISDTVPEADAAETWTASCWVYIVAGDFALVLQENAGGWSNIGTQAITATGAWTRAEVTATLSGGVTDVRLVVTPNATDASEFYMDGVQLEQKSFSTTYADGDQAGCEWNGTRHASTSTRSAQSRAGGRVYDLDTQYGFKIGQMIGIGAAPQSPDYEEHALLPGGSVSSAKTHGRVFTLQGLMLGASGSISDLHAQREALYSVLDLDAMPYTEDGPQPVILRYRGAAVAKEISCHYEGGFQGTFNAQFCAFERIALRFLAPDPYWYQIGQTSAVLDSNDTATLRYVAGRLRSTGQWDDLGLAANPNIGGTMYPVLVASDKTVYYGGDFVGFGGNAGWDYLVKYTPSTDTWARLDGASEFNDLVVALAEAPDGTIYIGGLFTDAGDANGDYLATYTPSTDTVASVSGGGTGQVETLAFDNNGLLIIGGLFVAWNGVNESECIVSWDGAAYAAMGNGFDATVSSVVVASDNTVYATGLFTTDWDASNPFVRFASWDGASWTQVGNGLNAQGIDLVVTSSDIVTVCGLFTNQDGIAEADYICQWNGSAISAMGSGANAGVWALAIAPNGDIYASGAFTAIGGVTTRYGRWNGSSWSSSDVSLPGAPTVRDAAFGSIDPVVPNNFDHWIGFSTTGAGYYSGTATVTNGGTAPIYPQFVVNRAGGTSARLISLRNETTGKELSFDYSLLDDETLTVDMDPQSQTVISSFFVGSRFGAYLAGGDLGTWSLQPGANQVTCFVDTDATVVAYLIWRAAYKAAD